EWTNVKNRAGLDPVAHFPDNANDAATRAAPNVAAVNPANSWNTQTGSCGGPTLVSITLQPAAINLYNAQFQTIAAACLWSDSTTVCPTLTWTSGTPAVATVSSSGVVTGISLGSASITASANSITSNATVITEFGPAPAISIGIIAQAGAKLSGQVAMQ